MRAVVAGFEPFGGRRRNRSERAVRRLAGMPDVEVATLPVSFARLACALEGLFADDPELVLLCGESRRADEILVERFALNVADSRIPDNDGVLARGARLDHGGPLAREVQFDPTRVVEALRADGLRAAVSSHAGTFLCNAALYQALAHPRALVAFIHLPAQRRHLGAGAAARGLRIALQVMADLRRHS
ncbi:MAG: pyroglutamyl-peptidase I [Polyangia bacterium]